MSETHERTLGFAAVLDRVVCMRQGEGMVRAKAEEVVCFCTNKDHQKLAAN